MGAPKFTTVAPLVHAGLASAPNTPAASRVTTYVGADEASVTIKYSQLTPLLITNLSLTENVSLPNIVIVAESRAVISAARVSPPATANEPPIALTVLTS